MRGCEGVFPNGARKGPGARRALLAALLVLGSAMPLGVMLPTAASPGGPEAPAASLPDLVPVQLRTEPAEPRPGEGVTFHVEVLNVGAGDAGAFWVRVTLQDGGFQAEGFVPAVGAGDSVHVESGVWTAEDGPHTWRVEADFRGDVEEPREDNNVAEATVHVGGFVNIAILGVTTAEPAAPRPGDEVTLGARFVNRGTRTQGPFEVRMAIEGGAGAFEARVPVPGLTPGQEVTVRAGPWALPAGVYLTFAEALVEDTQWWDHRWVGFLTVGDTDLVTEAVEVVPFDLAPGEEARFEATVRNDGPLASWFEAIFRIDGAPLGRSAEWLNAGATGAFPSEAWTATGGMHAVRFAAAPDPLVPDRDPANNHLGKVFTVLVPDPAVAAADLHARPVGLPRLLPEGAPEPGLPNPLAGHEVEVTVRNLGEGRTWKGGFTVEATVCPRAGVASPGGACETLDRWEVRDPVPAGGSVTFRAAWDSAGAVGDFDLCATIAYPQEQAGTDNDAACAPADTLLGGLGLGGRHLLP